MNWAYNKGKAMYTYGVNKVKSGLNWAYNKGKAMLTRSYNLDAIIVVVYAVNSNM